jgi:hypothetical protein
MDYEYYDWKCSYYTALKYVELLYKSDPNYSDYSCIDSYLTNMPDFADYMTACSELDTLNAAILKAS